MRRAAPLPGMKPAVLKPAPKRKRRAENTDGANDAETAESAENA